MHEHQHDAAVGQSQRAPLDRLDAPLEEHGVDQQDEGRRQEQDQALQAHRDVLQPEEVEVARQVVADQAEPGQAPAVRGRERRSGAHLPDRHRGEHRQREQHSERDQSNGIDVVPVQQFCDHRLRRKQDGAGDRDGEAGDESGAW